MRILVQFSLGLIFIVNTSCIAGGIQVGRTRIIYDANKKEVELPLTNKDKSLPWLIQSWSDIGDGKTKGPFIVTPPLFRLDPEKEQSLRITWTGQTLPSDRESLFYINVRTIPATTKEDADKNVLRLIYKTRMKMFWRPTGLSSTAGESCKNIHFTLNGKDLVIVNDGSFYSIFDSVRIDGHLLENAEMIAPKSTVRLVLESNFSAARQIDWRCITDYGNASEKFTARLR
jgi:P pilus assembly chaperone PapD